MVRWGFEGLAINEMRGLALKCDLPPLRKVVLPTRVIPLTKTMYVNVNVCVYNLQQTSPMSL